MQKIGIAGAAAYSDPPATAAPAMEPRAHGGSPYQVAGVADSASRALITFTADEGWLYPLLRRKHGTDWTSDLVLRSTRIMPSRKNSTTCRSGSREKNTSCSERHPVLALVVERLKQSAAQRTASNHRRLPSTPMLGIRARSTPGKSREISRRASWLPFIARQIAFSTTVLCCGLPGAVPSWRIPAESQNPTKLRPVNSPPLSVRKQRGRPMAFISARNVWTYAVVSNFFIMPYGHIHLEALSTNMIR